MTATALISDALLVAGLVVVVGACAGMAVFDDPLDRLHLVAPAAMLGSTGICASIVARFDLSASGLAALGVAAILIAANPLTGHAVARAIAIRRGVIWSDPADAAAAAAPAPAPAPARHGNAAPSPGNAGSSGDGS